jgi:hypothetical protein
MRSGRRLDYHQTIHPNEFLRVLPPTLLLPRSFVSQLSGTFDGLLPYPRFIHANLVVFALGAYSEASADSFDRRGQLGRCIQTLIHTPDRPLCTVVSGQVEMKVSEWRREEDITQRCSAGSGSCRGRSIGEDNAESRKSTFICTRNYERRY